MNGNESSTQDTVEEPVNVNTRRTCEITWCEHRAGHGPRNARCRCHGPLVDELGPGSPDCPDAVSR